MHQESPAPQPKCNRTNQQTLQPFDNRHPSIRLNVAVVFFRGRYQVLVADVPSSHVLKNNDSLYMIAKTTLASTTVLCNPLLLLLHCLKL